MTLDDLGDRVDDVDGDTGPDCYRCTTNPANTGHLCRACWAEIVHAHAQLDIAEGPPPARQPWDVPLPLAYKPGDPT